MAMVTNEGGGDEERKGMDIPFSYSYYYYYYYHCS